MSDLSFLLMEKPYPVPILECKKSVYEKNRSTRTIREKRFEVIYKILSESEVTTLDVSESLGTHRETIVEAFRELQSVGLADRKLIPLGPNGGYTYKWSAIH